MLNKTCIRWLLLAIATTALSNPASNQRRLFLGKAAASFAVAASPVLSVPSASVALDMDAFINSELSKDTNANMNSSKKAGEVDDTLICRYGSPGQETGDACVRAGLPTTRKPGGVDAYGKIDRGDFIRCTTKYVIKNDQYEKVVTCADSKTSFIKET